MSLHLSNANAMFFHHNKSQFKNLCFSHVSASLDHGLEREAGANSLSLCFEETRERIANLIQKPQLSISTYDTAWVAMVPAQHSSLEPRFPDCVKWLLENQCADGSWARPHHHCYLQKDVLSSTLACILALKRWGLGDDQVSRGVHFIESNFASVTKKDQIPTMGFDVIFAGMLEYARDLSLDLSLEPTTLNDLVHKRNMKLKRWYESHSMGMESYMAYLSEGIGKLQDWNSTMKYQQRNGSLFNSPSTTAAACIFHHNAGCLDYLCSSLKTFGNAVPAIYPLNVYAQLRTIDNLEQLGISQYFQKEIQSGLDEIYRCWLQGADEIFMDASTCPLAFRLLRVNGYDITSDQINGPLEAGCLSSFSAGHIKDIRTALDAYRATEVIFPCEATLEKYNLRIKDSLEQELTRTSDLGKDVKHALQHPSYAIMKRVANRINIEQYNVDNTRVLKTSLCSPNFGHKDFLILSVADFNRCQKMHQEELKELERWVIENRLDELKFARQKSAYCYFSAAATFASPELFDARISWAKNGVLTTVVDDFFDVGGSLEELKNLIHLVEVWEVDACMESSQDVLILFSALKNTISDIGGKASVRQERNVTKHIIDIWLQLLHSMLRESEWTRDGYTPTLDEYMRNGYVSFALGPIVLPALYLAGPKLSHEMVQHSHYNNLFRAMSTCGRLLNDMRGYERESKENKKTSVQLYMLKAGGDITEELAIAEVQKMIDYNRKELLRLVLESKNSVLPRACKDLFWHMSTVLHQFYIKDDGFTSDDLMKIVQKIIYEPIVLGEI